MNRLLLVTALASLPGTALAADGFKEFAVTSEDGSSTLKIGTRLQAMETLTIPDDDDAKAESSFSIHRARLAMEGNAFTDDLEYKLQLDAGKGQVTLKDWYADWRLGGETWLRVGQQKVFYSRQKLTSSSKLELVDRALTDEEFDPDRDIGLQLHNQIEDSPGFEWSAGVFNGTGEKGRFSVKTDENGTPDFGSAKFSNTTKRSMPQVAVRLGWNSAKTKGYSEGDLEGGPLRLSVGAGVVMDLDLDGGEDGAMGATLDVLAKVEGLAVGGAFFLARTQKAGGDGFLDQEAEAMGFNVQASYVLAERWMPSVRYTLIMPDADGAEDSSEAAVGLTAMIHGHKVKWANEVGTQDLAGTKQTLARSMFQFSF